MQEQKDLKNEINQYLRNAEEGEYCIDNKLVISIKVNKTKPKKKPFSKKNVEELLGAYFSSVGVENPEIKAKECRNYIVNDVKGGDGKVVEYPSRPIIEGGKEFKSISYKILKPKKNRINIRTKVVKENINESNMNNNEQHGVMKF
jgi:hypothetical protein